MKIKHFGVIKFVNLIAAILFLVMGILLAMGFTINLSVVEELQEAANFDSWKIFILLAGMVAILTSAVLAFGSWKEFQMFSGSHNSVVAETLYILGLGKEMERPACLGSETDTSVSSVKSSMISIFGFGYDDSNKWTFAGRKPFPREDPENTDAADDQEKPKENFGSAEDRSEETAGDVKEMLKQNQNQPDENVGDGQDTSNNNVIVGEAQEKSKDMVGDGQDQDRSLGPDKEATKLGLS
jgi:hypothetical protein